MKHATDANTVGRWLRPLALAAVLGLSGCAHFWEDVTSHSPEGGFGNDMAYRWKLLWHHEDPLITLRDSHDGDMKARAYRALKEPKANGGSDQDQEAILKILAAGAAEEPSMVCRLAAIEKLGEFQDPRAAAALKEAYFSKLNGGPRNAVVRQGALKSLAQTRQPDAVQVLVEATLYGEEMDVRLVAAEGLGNFKDAQASGALVQVLQKDKDIALRGKAAKSLEQITGRSLPAQAEPWEDHFRRVASGEVPPQQPKSSVSPAAWFQGGK